MALGSVRQFLFLVQRRCTKEEKTGTISRLKACHAPQLHMCCYLGWEQHRQIWKVLKASELTRSFSNANKPGLSAAVLVQLSCFWSRWHCVETYSMFECMWLGMVSLLHRPGLCLQGGICFYAEGQCGVDLPHYPSSLCILQHQDKPWSTRNWPTLKVRSFALFPSLILNLCSSQNEEGHLT